MKIIVTDRNVRPPSQKTLARLSGVMEYTLRKRIHELLPMVLENGWTLKKGIRLYP